MQTRFWVLAALALSGAAAYWTGCGGSDTQNDTRFFGDVATVVSARKPDTHRSYAFHLPEIPASAFAACAAPGAGAQLLFCVKTSTFQVCEPVNSACTFELRTGLEQDRQPVQMQFVDDTNGNGSADSGEAASTVAQSLLYCNGDQVSIAGADINFTSGVTTATVTKTVDRCSVATSTARPSGTATPTPIGGVSGTPTPTATYSAAASLNEPPASLLAFLFSVGAVGLLVPRRRN